MAENRVDLVGLARLGFSPAYAALTAARWSKARAELPDPRMRTKGSPAVRASAAWALLRLRKRLMASEASKLPEDRSNLNSGS
jgi:hypothetical protein